MAGAIVEATDVGVEEVALGGGQGERTVDSEK